MKVIIESHIDTVQTDVDGIREYALKMVESLDKFNQEDNEGKDVITKLYFISPLAGKIFVVVSKEDAKTLNVDSQVLAERDIKDYPLERMPAKIIDYKELIIKKGNNINLTDIMNVAQAIADDAFKDDLPNKIPVIKILNYNGQAVKNLAMPSVFGDNVFYSLSGVVTNGDAKAGKEVIDISNYKQNITASKFISLFESIPKDTTLEKKTYIINGVGKGFRGGVFEFRQRGDIGTFDLNGSTFVSIDYVGNTDWPQMINFSEHVYGTIKNGTFIIKNAKKLHKLISIGINQGYGDENDVLTFENVKFINKDSNYEYLLYLNGSSVVFKDCEFVLPIKNLKTYSNEGSRKFVNCKFTYTDSGKTEIIG